MPEDAGPHPDPHLTPAERERLHPGIDVAALERLLAALPPDLREIVLDAFDANPRFRAFEAELEAMSLVGGVHGRPMIPSALDLSFTDPALQQLLAPVNASLRSARDAEALRRRAPDWYQQVERPAREAPVLLVMPSEWADDAAALVVRRIDAAPCDLILIDAERATAAALDIALEALLTERRYFGVTPRAAHTIAIGATRTMMLSGAQEARLTEILRQLAEQPERAIDGVGPVRAMEFRIAE